VDTAARKFRKGNFVRAIYDYELTYCFADTPHHLVHYGVIVQHGETNIYFPYGNYFYQVLCLDGIVRFFTEWEIEKV